jgi:hypothetical protein
VNPNHLRNFNLVDPNRDAGGLHDCVLAQLFRVVSARVTPKDQSLFKKDELEIAHHPGQPAPDMLFRTGQTLVGGRVTRKVLLHRDTSSAGRSPSGFPCECRLPFDRTPCRKKILR